MKKFEEYLGLPIISITEGRELGLSKSLLIDAEHGSIAAIIIEDKDWYRGVKLLPYMSVVAIGHDAITITSSEDILTLDDAVEYEPFLDQNIHVVGTKAITKGGTIQGVVSDIYIDDNGKIAKVVLTTKGEAKEKETPKEISSEEISIFGKEVTIIESPVPTKDEKEETKIKPAQPTNTNTKPTTSVQPQLKTETKAAKPVEKHVSPSTISSTQKPAAAKTAITSQADTATVHNPTTPAHAASNTKNANSVTSSSAEDRHRRFLLGKKATRRITTDNGIVIVEEGADITEEVLQKAKLANKFIELSMNVK